MIGCAEGTKKANKRPMWVRCSVVEKAESEQMLPVRLAFMLSATHKFEPFLAKFHMDKPMVPFLAAAIESLLQLMLTRIVKVHILNVGQKQLAIALQVLMENKSGCRAGWLTGLETEQALQTYMKVCGLSSTQMSYIRVLLDAA